MKNMKAFILALLFILVGGHAFSQNEEEEILKTNDWEAIISPYAFLAAQSTDVGGEKIRQSFSDLSSITNTGFQIAVSVKYKRFITRFDGTWAWLATEEKSSALEVEANIRQQILDFRGGYIVYENLSMASNEVIKGWDLEVNAGAKYWNNTVDIDYRVIINDIPILEGSINEPQEWWDFMIGVKPTIYVTPRMKINTSFSAGGFGIGNSSKFTYDFIYANSFKVTKLITVDAGFRNFMYDRVDGEGESQVDTRVNVIGPFVGVSIIWD